MQKRDGVTQYTKALISLFFTMQCVYISQFRVITCSDIIVTFISLVFGADKNSIIIIIIISQSFNSFQVNIL